MLSKEDCDSWNEFFPHATIKQTDLANPTEAFLTKTLIFYLQKFGYDINVNMLYPQKGNELDNLRERRLFLIKLAKHIDHILKITDKAYIFTYYDLIHPTPKKTSHMLGILLNYLCYFNCYKTEVFTKANAAIETRDELLKRVHEVEEENLARKLKAEKIKEEIVELSEQLPAAQTEYATLNAAKLKKNEDIQQLKELQVKLQELNLQKRNLEKKIVPDSEVKELQLQLKNLQLKIKEQNEQEANIKSSLKESTDNIKIMQDLSKDIAETQELLPMRQLTALKDVDKQIKDAKLRSSAKKQTKQLLLSQLETQQGEMKMLDRKITTLKKQFEKEKSEKIKKISALESECKNNEAQLNNQENELHTLDCLFKEQENLSHYLEEQIGILMHPYK